MLIDISIMSIIMCITIIVIILRTMHNEHEPLDPAFSHGLALADFIPNTESRTGLLCLL